MNIILYAIPFFILSIIIELITDRVKQTGYYKQSDSMSSVSMGILSRTFRFFTGVIPVFVYAWVAGNIGIEQIDESAFSLFSLRGILAFSGVMILWDFCYYWSHRIGHERAFFWNHHVVHHQSEEYNLSTALRQGSTGFFLGWIFHLPHALMGIPPEIYISAGALNLIYQFWVHTRFVGKLGWFDYVFVSPSNHRVHHAQNDIYLDKNYGGIFIIWDRFFGTFQEERDDEPVVYGVKKSLNSWNPFRAVLDPWASMAKDSFRTKKWSDKLKVWVERTGWRPEDVNEKYPIKLNDPATFKKFAPPVSKSILRYNFFQYIAILTATFVILLKAKALIAQTGLLLFPIVLAPLWLSMYSAGILSEGLTQKPHGIKLEWARLAFLFFGLPVGAYFLLPAYLTSVSAGIWAVYLIGSAISFGLVTRRLGRTGVESSFGGINEEQAALTEAGAA